MYDEIRRIRAIADVLVVRTNISRIRSCLFPVWLVALSNFLLQFRLFFKETNAARVTRILEVQRSCGQLKTLDTAEKAKAWVITRTNCQFCEDLLLIQTYFSIFFFLTL